MAEIQFLFQSFSFRQYDSYYKLKFQFTYNYPVCCSVYSKHWCYWTTYLSSTRNSLWSWGATS